MMLFLIYIEHHHTIGRENEVDLEFFSYQKLSSCLRVTYYITEDKLLNVSNNFPACFFSIAKIKLSKGEGFYTVRSGKSNRINPPSSSHPCEDERGSRFRARTGNRYGNDDVYAIPL